MMTGTWSVACLLLAAGTGVSPSSPEGVTFCNKTTLDFPITVDPSRQKSIRELELYVSTNQGRSWELAAKAAPTQSLFRCTVPGEGLYWFTVLILDQNRRKEPPSPYGAEPGQKLIVDMKKPDVHLVSAERKDGTVVVRWDISEEYLNLPSLKLEYRPADGPETWTSVPVTREQSGQAVIESPAALTVRMSVEDLAHNVGMAEAKVPAAASATTAVAIKPIESTGDAAGSNPAGAGTSPPAPPAAGPAATAATTLPTSLPSPIAAPPAVAPGPVASSGEGPPAPPAGDSASLQRVSVSPAPPRSSLGSGAVEELTPPPSSGKEPGGVVASSPAATSPSAPPASLPGVTPDKDLALQVINTRRVTMEYEVAKLGPSGVGSVELYVTRDNGLKWDRIEGEHGGSPPAPGGKSAEVLHRTLSVDMAADGVYGFYLVVKSGAGRGNQPPRAGEPPQWRVEIDTSRPEALLYGPQANPGQSDVLVLSWKATDNRLAANPISLQWADRKDGEWHSIGEAQMPNSGSYNWHVPANIPAKVYLRLTARDAAGNVAVAETGEPVLVDLSVPVPRILGLVKSAPQ